jgi:hypothetical protein
VSERGSKVRYELLEYALVIFLGLFWQGLNVGVVWDMIWWSFGEEVGEGRVWRLFGEGGGRVGFGVRVTTFGGNGSSAMVPTGIATICYFHGTIMPVISDYQGLDRAIDPMLLSHNDDLWDLCGLRL